GTRRYARRFEEELRVPGPRVPLTSDAALFRHAVTLGRQLLDAHTYRRVSSGAARETMPIGEQLPTSFVYAADTATRRLGPGAIAPVPPDAWTYHVSGLQVIRAWLRRRITPRRGRSPLDALVLTRWSPTLTRELLELVWLLETTLSLEPALDGL